MLEVADVFRRYGPEYLKKYGENMLPSHHRAFRDILNCRTAALGGHVYSCDHCHHEVYSYHSCKNRSCPKCHGGDTQRWLEKRQKELLPVKYFHVVSTIPQELRACVRSHQKVMYNILMKAAAGSLIKLASDPHYVGGLIGVMAVLHTWSRTLGYHPHVHCLVPAGGVSSENQWLGARGNYLVPVKALSKIFRGIVLKLMAKELPEIKIPPAVWEKDWVVYCKPAVQGPEKVLKYLGRYVHRIAIANSRILSIDNGKVSFKYQDSRTYQWKIMTLEAFEFIRRFLQHVLPAGMHKVRYYGLWNPAHRKTLHSLQIVLANENTTPQQMAAAMEQLAEVVTAAPIQKVKTCPHCGQGILACIKNIPRQYGKPP